jgi:hypothetical protein
MKTPSSISFCHRASTVSTSAPRELLGEIEWPVQAQLLQLVTRFLDRHQGGLAKSDVSLRRQGSEAAARMRRRRQAGCLYLSDDNPAAGPKQVAAAQSRG